MVTHRVGARAAGAILAIPTTSRLPSDQGGASEPECYDPSHVVEGNHELDINFTQETETCDGGSHRYTSGIVTTNGNFSFTYGYVEFRAWLPTASNGQVADWPDLWAAGQDWPTDGEIDVVEGLGGTACGHWHGPTGDGAGFGAGGGTGCPAGTYTGGWHTFGADWEPGSVTWYYDGQAVGSLTTGVTSDPMMIIMDVAIAAGDPVQSPGTMKVSYVKVWQQNS